MNEMQRQQLMKLYATLDRLELKGRENCAMLLGCMQLIEQMLGKGTKGTEENAGRETDFA